MIVRDLKRLALVVGPLLALILLSASLWHTHPDYLRSHVTALVGKKPGAAGEGSGTSDKPSVPAKDANETHDEIFAVSTPDGKYLKIRFGQKTFNPNLIPHPSRDNMWIAVSRQWKDPSKKPTVYQYQLGCTVQLVDGELVCIDPVKVVPYEPTPGGKCEGEIDFFSLNVGPHDARVFYGPQTPYTIYGSNSGITCFGQWMQDFRRLVDWDVEPPKSDDDFAEGTELQRPPPYFPVEKNWFVFWDRDDRLHGHYDMFPKRAIARLASDGSAGPELASPAAAQDERCMARYLPKLPPKLESIHQATNSLRVTLCERADAGCRPGDDNTFILTLIHHKTFYDWHGEYEPYVVLFRQRAPFELHAISRRPLWIHGRRRVSDTRTEMFYVTSINWKARGARYHGFLDDELFLGFGVEDRESAAIDLRASDLLANLGLCSEA